MKKLKQVFSIGLIALTFMSCDSLSSKQPENAKDFKAIEDNLKSEFGDNAYYTDLSVFYNQQIGTSVSVTVTKDPESLKMGEWNDSQGWNQTAEVSLELPEGTQAKDFMFKLDDKINLSILGECVEKSMNKLKNEKDIENPVIQIVSVKFPDNGDYDNAKYSINLEPEGGGTTFRFSYGLDGELINFDY